ncbi:Phytanoyl-CoA dioxygenase [Seminavis robusta]|uniref:Phytanoyl-CoA dioxygenase n=1 Tax=Seminavis robusta TaxID=568900 RepID=A0A9N8EEJ8_9STRA|nr:Phytanoyl-CoA dioxygenase [Seminavis robusta]|eukprot:Sro1010_g230850.1 Phytanoyl-CoA dioxygenase (459) ;mRNA; f:13429-14899
MGSTLQQHIFRTLFLVVVLIVVLPCPADGGSDELLEERKEALATLVHGYVFGEKKVSYDDVLEKVKLIIGNDNHENELLSVVEEAVQEAMEDTTMYADQLILDMLTTVTDPDCMKREFDVSDIIDGFNATEASHVLHKCKLLVLRNVFDQEFLNEYKANFTAFIQGLRNGNIDLSGTTTNNEHYFQHKLDDGRWEVLLPKNLAHSMVVNNNHILRVLMQDIILGPDLNLHSFGTALADSGAGPQDWHTDSDFLFGDALYQTTGISQHHLPAYAITMMVPLLDMTPEHGPTQFSMGSSNLAGLTEKRDNIPLRNEWLRPFINDQPDLDVEGDLRDYKYMRTPLIGFGDVLLFDYQITHRGGKNKSPDLRAMLYLTYSRFWYKDKGFEDDEVDSYGEEQSDNEKKLYKKLTETARFAIPDNFEIDLETDWSEYSDGDENLEAMGSFHKQAGSPGDSDEEL